jgi:predicted metallopeptidase
MIIEQHCISDESVIVLAKIGRTRAMVRITMDRVVVITNYGSKTKAACTLFSGSKAMRNAKAKHTGPEIAQVLAAADWLNH